MGLHKHREKRGQLGLPRIQVIHMSPCAWVSVQVKPIWKYNKLGVHELGFV